MLESERDALYGRDKVSRLERENERLRIVARENGTEAREAEKRAILAEHDLTCLRTENERLRRAIRKHRATAPKRHNPFGREVYNVQGTERDDRLYRALTPPPAEEDERG